jgi:hypothetical protein
MYTWDGDDQSSYGSGGYATSPGESPPLQLPPARRAIFREVSLLTPPLQALEAADVARDVAGNFSLSYIFDLAA